MLDWLSAETVGVLGRGLLVTILLTVLTTVAAVAVALVVTRARFSRRRVVRALATAYVEVFRNVPALIQIIFWAFAFPSVFPDELRRTLFFDNVAVDALADLTGLPLPYYAVAAGFALVLNTSGHLAEILTAGVGAVAREHLDAARTLGASHHTALSSVALPAAVRVSFPAIANRLVHNMKNTALASFAAVPELFHQMEASINRTFQATEYLVVTAAVYLALSLALTALLDWIDRRLHNDRRPTLSPSAATPIRSTAGPTDG